MKTAITTTDPTQIVQLNDLMQQAGQTANESAARHAFAVHTARKADNTLHRKMADLTTRKHGGVLHGGLSKPLETGCYSRAMQLEA